MNTRTKPAARLDKFDILINNSVINQGDTPAQKEMDYIEDCSMFVNSVMQIDKKQKV